MEIRHIPIIQTSCLQIGSNDRDTGGNAVPQNCQQPAVLIFKVCVLQGGQIINQQDDLRHVRITGFPISSKGTASLLQQLFFSMRNFHLQQLEQVFHPFVICWCHNAADMRQILHISKYHRRKINDIENDFLWPIICGQIP